MSASRPPTRYEFGDFILDGTRQRLTRRSTGEVIPLTGKVFDTLLLLVERAGETVDKDTLLKTIWPNVIVEENSLTQNISMLRQVLGETRGENRYIATIARRGYRFVAEVKRGDEPAPSAAQPNAAPAIDASAQPQSASRKGTVWWISGATALLLAAALTVFFTLKPAEPTSAAGQTLAILPFKPLLPAERNESLELGMTESLISSLGQHSLLAVRPLSSVRRYAALDQDAITAGRELGVDTVLDGSLQRRDDRLRVSARLLRVADGRQLWAQVFDQEFTTIFEVQDFIAAKVARSLLVRWPGNEPRTATGTRDPEAYALYASGRFVWYQQDERGLLQAIEFYEKALARDPKYARAYTGIADSYAILGVFGMRAPHEVFPKARAAVDKALELDPTLADAHVALGHIKIQYEHDWDGGAREYSTALKLDPDLALAYQRRGLLYGIQGNLERALAETARAQEIEPLWLSARAVSANFMYYARRFDESIRVCEQVLALDERTVNARGILIRSLIAKGDYDRAIAEYDKAPIYYPGSRGFRAQALALSGRRTEALEELQRMYKLSKERYVAAYDIASIHAALKDADNAFLWLDRAFEDRSTQLGFIAQDPIFESLRTDPRFDDVVKRIGIYGRKLPE